jgi:1-acyl-sn-glycerol-3-phosphate acyltransferase
MAEIVDSREVAEPPQPPFFLRWCGTVALKLMGWQLEGARELLYEYDSYIVVAAPHTSNWDSVIGIFSLWAANIQPTIIVKKEVIDVLLIGWFFSHILGDMAADMQPIRDVLATVTPKYPAQKDEI